MIRPKRFCEWSPVQLLLPDKPRDMLQVNYSCLLYMVLLPMVIFIFMSIIGPAQATEIRIATFNTESDADTNPMKVAETIRSIDGVDIWGLQEVESEDALKLYRDAAKNSGHGK